MWRALVLAAASMTATTARADAPRATPIGFDHNFHDRDVIVSGGETLPCARCHVLKNGRLVGRPEHAACFGACHPAPPRPRRGAKLALAPDRLKLCTNCHAEAALVAPFTGKLPVAYPPYLIDLDFNLVLGHRQHRAIACTQCHDPNTGKKPPAHQRCAGCHDGTGGGAGPTAKGPAMTACGLCHPPAIGKPQPPELAVVQNSVRSIYSHASHAARGGAGKVCSTCHAKIADANETVIELPRPTVANCATCHDGKTAFATTTACTRCHAAPTDQTAVFDVARPTARFSHTGSHALLVGKQPCTSCHRLDAKTGEVEIGGHGLCTGCHADDFAKRFPTRCGACHGATEPWRHLRADRPPPDATEFGASLDHAKHRGACTTCHALTTATTQLRMPRGHAACTGAACHAATTGPAPHLGTCGDCHRLGLVADRTAKRAADPWSVRLAFAHASHDKGADGSALACTSCHVTLAGGLLDLQAPPKATCAPCHDGTRAFKLTGTTCGRCHLAAKP
jgi:c(7)-type cytochrome triheme protein